MARVFNTSWETVFQSVDWVVSYGLAHRERDNVEQIGVEEIFVFKVYRCLTLVYQLDKGFRRLLWCAPKREAETLLKFFRASGKERSKDCVSSVAICGHPI